MRNLSLILSILLTCFNLTTVHVQAQQKEDVIYLSNGEQKKGKVISVSEDEIKFSYSGEEVVYELKKKTIAKIVFANGREEIMAPNNKESVPNNSRNIAISGNKILAVVPFEIVSNEAGIMNDGMRKKIQESCIEALNKQGLSVQFQDTKTTNTLLSKAGINFSDIDNHTPEELVQLLGVDYIVLGVYDIDNKGVSTYGSGVTSSETKQKEGKEKGTKYTSNNSYTTTNYKTKVHLTIYDSVGHQLFSDIRSPLFGSLDSYVGALKTLAKRVPLKK